MQDKKINVMSLFGGIECGRLACQRAGFNIGKYYSSEIDKFAIQIAQKNFPSIIQVGDVKEIDFQKYRGKIDLLMGGSPCQDLSRAKGNKRQGLNGSHSGLFWYFAIAKDILNPKYFLLENNYGMPQKAKETISNILGVEPILINSSLFSAQNRKRLYWTNIPIDKNISDKNISLQPILEFGETTRAKSKTVRVGGGGSRWGDRHEWDRPNPSRVYTTIELERLQTLPDNYTAGVSETQRRKCIGNAWTVDVIAYILSFINFKQQGEM